MPSRNRRPLAGSVGALRGRRQISDTRSGVAIVTRIDGLDNVSDAGMVWAPPVRGAKYRIQHLLCDRSGNALQGSCVLRDVVIVQLDGSVLRHRRTAAQVCLESLSVLFGEDGMPDTNMRCSASFFVATDRPTRSVVVNR